MLEYWHLLGVEVNWPQKQDIEGGQCQHTSTLTEVLPDQCRVDNRAQQLPKREASSVGHKVEPPHSTALVSAPFVHPAVVVMSCDTERVSTDHYTSWVFPTCTILTHIHLHLMTSVCARVVLVAIVTHYAFLLFGLAECDREPSEYLEQKTHHYTNPNTPVFWY